MRKPSNAEEETKAGQQTDRDVENDAEMSNDYLLNYTFDLSLNDHLSGKRVGDPKFYQASGSVNDFGDLDDTVDQVDNLLDELNQFMHHRRNSQVEDGQYLTALESHRSEQ